mgnify:FL=1
MLRLADDLHLQSFAIVMRAQPATAKTADVAVELPPELAEITLRLDGEHLSIGELSDGTNEPPHWRVGLDRP